MAKILLDYSDGQYSTRRLDEAEAAELETKGIDVTYVQDHVYEAYLQHCAQNTVWQTLWQALSNEAYLRRRERELMPLEEAEREIARLKEDLARSERMHRHYEDEWLRATGRQSRTEHDNNGHYTCVFPQPGCDVSVLESVEWQAAATELLKKYNVELAQEGIRHQGCCCGHTHCLLSPETARRLRAAGFLVENETDPDEAV